MPCSRARDLQRHSPAEVLCDAVVATLISMYTPVYAGLVRRLGHLPNLLQEMREYVRRRTLLETTYVRAPHVNQWHPKSTTHTPSFLDDKYGTGDKWKLRIDWKKSSQWHYWIEGCLTNSSPHFHKFLQVTRTPFDEIYLTAVDSGQFRINPEEPLFDRKYLPVSTVPNFHRSFNSVRELVLVCATWPRASRTPPSKPVSRFRKSCCWPSSPSFSRGSWRSTTLYM